MVLNIKEDKSRKVYIREGQCRLLVEAANDRYSRPGFEMLVGIPGCGKSTYIRNIKERNKNIIVVCPDDIRRRDFGDVNRQDCNDKVWETANGDINDALKCGGYVILDATNVGTRNRVRLLGRIRNEYPGVPCYATVFECNPDVSKERVSRDIANGVDRSNVPPEVIDRMYGQYLETLKAIDGEGFDGIFRYGGSNEGRVFGEAKASPTGLQLYVDEVYNGKYDAEIYDIMHNRLSPNRSLYRYLRQFRLDDDEKQSLYECMVARYEYLWTCMANTAEIGKCIVDGMFDEDIDSRDYSWFYNAAEQEPIDIDFISHYITNRIRKNRKLFKNLKYTSVCLNGSKYLLGRLMSPGALLRMMTKEEKSKKGNMLNEAQMDFSHLYSLASNRSIFSFDNDNDIKEYVVNYINWSSRGEFDPSFSVLASKLHDALMYTLGLKHEDVNDRRTFARIIGYCRTLLKTIDVSKIECSFGRWFIAPNYSSGNSAMMSIYTKDFKNGEYSSGDILSRAIVYETHSGVKKLDSDYRPGSENGSTGVYCTSAIMTDEMKQKILDMHLVPALLVDGSYHENFIYSIGILPEYVSSIKNKPGYGNIFFDCKFDLKDEEWYEDDYEDDY